MSSRGVVGMPIVKTGNIVTYGVVGMLTDKTGNMSTQCTVGVLTGKTGVMTIRMVVGLMAVKTGHTRSSLGRCTLFLGVGIFWMNDRCNAALQSA